MALYGKFELVEDKGQLEHMIANGLPEDRAKGIIEGSQSLEILIDGGKVSFTRGGGRTQVLTLDQEVEEASPGGSTLKSTATLDGNKLTINSKGGQGSWKREYVISGSELTVTSISDKAGVPNGVRIYKRA